MGMVLLCSKLFPRTQKHWRILHCFPGSQGFSKVQHCLFLLPATKEYKLMYYVNAQIICSRVVFNLCHLMTDERKGGKKKGGKKRERKESMLALITWYKLERIMSPPWAFIRKDQTTHNPKRCKLKGKPSPRWLLFMFYPACVISGDVLTIFLVHHRESYRKSALHIYSGARTAYTCCNEFSQVPHPPE